MRLTPGASSDGFGGLVTDAAGVVRLKARVRAIAENNKANRALELLIARRLNVGKSRVRVTAGETSRNKMARIDGDPSDIAVRISALAETGGPLSKSLR